MGDVRAAVAAVVDPEIRVVTIDELGILRDVAEDPATGRVTVTITPTYTGCPAMDVIRADIRRALAAAGHPEAEVRTVLTPAWSTDWISDSGRAKLAAAGIAPPAPVRRDGVVPLTLAVRCPRCGSPETEQVSRFGSTACKALWRCRACREPFDHLKAL
ncbi:1,2-phenylacetyl-CoA epoxidase subunit PaaD [Micromonospora echinofusca]|uniref:Phenylacetate-CoA oxygenase subunit PaaJ n=1 Tax=Micromonospora echinofusca TaxID=47858 RepID=A0ABS3VRF0_MICEH|nr:1,2-phenylacetyl-CoA epoxidase subunit PaaD [Micromonospora echinofusca]MBO4206973.1 phenylacetate-CoA oxygenase subunit PaaJ [Micromonospora echinofusca]